MVAVHRRQESEDVLAEVGKGMSAQHGLLKPSLHQEEYPFGA